LGVGSVKNSWGAIPSQQIVLDQGISRNYQGQLLYQGNFVQCTIDYELGAIDWYINGNKLPMYANFTLLAMVSQTNPAFPQRHNWS